VKKVRVDIKSSEVIDHLERFISNESPIFIWITKLIIGIERIKSTICN
jgi:hypothetical protein